MTPTEIVKPSVTSSVVLSMCWPQPHVKWARRRWSGNSVERRFFPLDGRGHSARHWAGQNRTRPLDKNRFPAREPAPILKTLHYARGGKIHRRSGGPSG